MKLLYFTDPMCSWCYGFAPVIEKIRKEYPEIELQIIGGGYSPGNREIITDEFKTFLHRAWTSVNFASGQPFDYDMKFANELFCYDSEPSNRALRVMQELKAEKDFEFLELLQKSFYAEGKDVTNEDILAGLAVKTSVDKEEFIEKFKSEEFIKKTEKGFILSRQMGVQGFPTLLGERDGKLTLLTNGFQPYDRMKLIMDKWLNETVVAEYKKSHSCEGNHCEY